MTESTALAVAEPRREPSSQAVSVWQSPAMFEQAQRMARALCNSPMVPTNYRGDANMGSALIALDIAQRVNASPLMVMQNLHIIEGKPSWASQFVIAALNSCGRFTPLRFRVVDKGVQKVQKDEWSGPKGERTKRVVSMDLPNKTCVAVSTDRATGEILEGPEVSIAMAFAEGWYTKPGSKWVTMEGLMLRYRAAKFFGNLYAPDILMGMPSVDERHDLDDVEYAEVKPVEQADAPAASESKPKRASRVAAAMAAAPAAEPKAEPAKVSSGVKPATKAAEPQPTTPAEPTHSELRDERADYGESDDGEGGADDGADYGERDGDTI